MMFEGRYSDGEHFRTVPVTLAPHGVSIESKPGHHDWWSFEQTRIQRHESGIRFELEKAVLEMNDPAFLSALQKANPRVERGQPPEGTTEFALRLGLLVVVICAAIIGILWAGIPVLTSAMARAVPVNIEDTLGRQTVDSLAPPARRMQDPALSKMLDRLVSAAPVSPYNFHLIVADDPTVNALAAPGGYIVVYRGLLEKVTRPEEAAAVLAHEMQHVLKRHVLQALIRNVSIASAIALVAGDSTSAMAQVGGTLTSLKYQRGDEWNADLDGYHLLKAAGFDPQAMISMLETLDKAQGGAPAGMPYLSTHPRTRDRISRLHDVVP
jgi:predicted Zn-dependent protease